MESYVIRIYRRDENEPQRVVGLVEYPENGITERFGHLAELMKILLSPQGSGTNAIAEEKGLNRKDLVVGPDKQDREKQRLFRYRNK